MKWLVLTEAETGKPIAVNMALSFSFARRGVSTDTIISSTHEDGGFVRVTESFEEVLMKAKALEG